MPGAQISESLELRSVESSMVSSLPDVCWLCGCKYNSAFGLAKHCAAKHGNLAEYRKRVLFIKKTRLLQPFRRGEAGNNPKCFSADSGKCSWQRCKRLA